MNENSFPPTTGDSDGLTTTAVVEYIDDMLDQLYLMSSNMGYPDLSCVLSLAREEARRLRLSRLDDGVTTAPGFRRPRQRGA